MTSGAYCAVQGCKNQKTMKEISFFKLPTDVKRREDWLYMIGRPDLQQKPDLKPECHFVCHVHFEEYMMTRKPLLRPNAIPTKNIPTLPILNETTKVPTTKEDKSTQTRRKFYKDLSNCKRKGVINESGMRIEIVGQFGPKKEKKRKLKQKLGESEAKRKKLETEIGELKKQLEAKTKTTAVINSAKVASSAEGDQKTPSNSTNTDEVPLSCKVVDEVTEITSTILVEIKQEKIDDEVNE